jgi:hypothetical protein
VLEPVAKPFVVASEPLVGPVGQLETSCLASQSIQICLPIILKGIMANSSLSNRFELIEMLDKMSQVDPQAQQAAQMQQQMAMQLAQAQIAVQTTQAEQNKAEAQKLLTEAQLMPIELQAKSMAANTKNLPTDDALASKEFDKRVKIAELMLKEADIQNKAKIVEKQMTRQ